MKNALLVAALCTFVAASAAAKDRPTGKATGKASGKVSAARTVSGSAGADIGVGTPANATIACVGGSYQNNGNTCCNTSGGGWACKIDGTWTQMATQ